MDTPSGDLNNLFPQSPTINEEDEAIKYELAYSIAYGNYKKENSTCKDQWPSTCGIVDQSELKEEKEEFSNEDWCIAANKNYETDSDATKGYQYHSSTLYKCSYCTQVFDSRNDVYRHNLVHMKIIITTLKRHCCIYCTEYFYEKSALKKHAKSTHTKTKCPERNNNKNYKCQYCTKTFTYRHWHEHINTVHGQEEITCKTCNSIFKCVTYYKKHKCMKRKKKNENVNETKETATCEECSKEMPSKSSLTLHLKNVHNIIVRGGRKVLPPQRLDCEECGSIFKSVNYLRTHMHRVHYSDGKMHACLQCGKKFKSPRRVRIHMKNAHMKKRHMKNEESKQRCETCFKVVKKCNYDKHVKECLVAVNVDDVKIEIEELSWD